MVPSALETLVTSRLFTGVEVKSADFTVRVTERYAVRSSTSPSSVNTKI